MPPAPDDTPPVADRRVTTARTKLLVSLALAVAAGVGGALAGWGRADPLVSWDVLALCFVGWVWFTIGRLSPAATEATARREDPGRDLTDLVLLAASAASLIAVLVIVFGQSAASADVRYLRAGLAFASVFASWALIHTVYTLKYARLYYSGEPGGIDFNSGSAPDYTDFAYLAFTVGMTFQVSDTMIGDRSIRRTVLRHGLLAFPFDTVIIATCVNLVAGLVR